MTLDRKHMRNGLRWSPADMITAAAEPAEEPKGKVAYQLALQGTRTCAKCGKTKPIAEFPGPYWKERVQRYVSLYDCRPCHKVINAARAQKRRDRLLKDAKT